MQAPLVSAVTANGRLLANFNAAGELTHLYWPHIDYPNHVAKVAAGLRISRHSGLYWLADAVWHHRQRYVGSAPVLETIAENEALGAKVTITDFATAGQDTLVRRYQVQNTGAHTCNFRLVFYAAFHLGESHRYNTVFWEPEAAALCFYRYDVWIAVGGARAPVAYKVGPRPYEGSAWHDAQDGELGGGVIEMNDVDGALAWDSPPVEPGEMWQITVFISCGPNRTAALAGLAAARGQGAGALEKVTSLAWSEWLESAARAKLTWGGEAVEELWSKSLMVIRLATDETGGIIAAPEFDPDRRWCGGYGYCWVRDAAYIVYALDVAGQHDMAAAFYRWAARAQEPSGVWYQRYYMNGALAPSWGLIQIDETGSILWGFWRHIAATGNTDLLQELWNMVERAAEFLHDFRDPETGLPRAAWDLWEERYGIHAYSCAAVYGGLVGASALANMAGYEQKAIRWQKAAAEIREATIRYFWSELHGRFLRCIDLRVPAWAMHDHNLRSRVRTLPPPPGHLYPEYAVPEDATVDASLLGLSVPFGLVQPDDPMMAATVAAIERDLATCPAGGVMRYTHDHYRGGNPWVICTLWLAGYYARLGKVARARELVQWVMGRQTATGLLPEQVDKHTGAPAWVVPLVWSHAMFILACAAVGAGQTESQAEGREILRNTGRPKCD